MKHTKRLENLMRLSWEVQRSKRFNRSRSLRSAWAIVLTEDITVFHLFRKHNGNRNTEKSTANELPLFKN